MKSSQRLRLTSELLVLAGAVIGFSVAAALRLGPLTSDDVAQQNIVRTLFAYPSRGIDLPANTYILKFPLYWLTQWLPLSPPARLTLVSVFLAVGALLLTYWALQRLSDDTNTSILSILVPLIWLAALGAGFANSLSNPNSRNIEIGLALAGIAIVAAWYKRPQPFRHSARLPAALLVVFAGLLFYDDPYFAVLTGLPLLIFFAVKWLWSGRAYKDKDLAVVACVIAAFIAQMLWHSVFQALGVHAGSTSLQFATTAQLGHNAALVTDGLIAIFNADIFGQPVFTLASMARAINFLILIGTLLSPLLWLWRPFRKNLWAVFFTLQPVFVVLAFTLSTEPQDISSSRYLVILPFYTVVLASYVLANLLPRRRLAVSTLLLAAALVGFTQTALAFSAGSSSNTAATRAVKAVHDDRLIKGFTDYWDAGIDQYFASSRTLFTQAGCSPSLGVNVYPFLLNTGQVSRPAASSFYLLNRAKSVCTAQDLRKFFGQPVRVVNLGSGRTLYIYDYDITSRITG